MPHENLNCDNALFHVLQECKTLPVFLDSVFGFLKRRTDFYVIANEPGSPVGLPMCMAENIVKQSFYKWQMDDDCNHSQTIASVCDPKANNKEKIISSATPIRGIQIQKATSKEKRSTTTSESYNGATKDNYMWSQSIHELDITVLLNEDISPRYLNAVFKKQHISVRDKMREVDVLVGELLHGIKSTEVIWSVDIQAHKLEIHMDKLQERWWDRLFVDDDALDVNKLDCSRPFDELSEQAQAKIEELRYNQDRKLAGLPTSEQMVAETTLKKAWNAEGSPFSGPFDMSKIIIEPKLMKIPP